MSDWVPIVVAAIGAVGAILGQVIPPIIAHKWPITPTKGEPSLEKGGVLGESHAAKVKGATRRKRTRERWGQVRNFGLILLVAGGSLFVWSIVPLTYRNPWFPTAVAMIGAIAATVCEFILKILSRGPKPSQHGSNKTGSHLKVPAAEARRSTEWKRARNLSLMLFVAGAAIDCGQAFLPRSETHSSGIRIIVRQIPPTDLQGGPERTGHIGGVVSGVLPSDFRIVIYAHTTHWYVQPSASSPWTGITSEGEWDSDTYLGDRYAILLVKPSYVPPAEVQALPGISGEVVSSTIVAGK